MYAGVPRVTPTCVNVDARSSRPRQRLADPEVGDHGMAFVQQDVLRLDVAMHDVVPVGIVERVGDLGRDPHGGFDGQMPFLRQSIAQRLPCITGIT